MSKRKGWGSTVFHGTLLDWYRAGDKAKWNQYIIEIHPPSTKVKIWRNNPLTNQNQKDTIAKGKRLLGIAKQTVGQEWDLSIPIPWTVIKNFVWAYQDSVGEKKTKNISELFHSLWYLGDIKKFGCPLEFMAVWGLKKELIDNLIVIKAIVMSSLDKVPRGSAMELVDRIYYIEQMVHKLLPQARPVKNKFPNVHWVLEPEDVGNEVTPDFIGVDSGPIFDLIESAKVWKIESHAFDGPYWPGEKKIFDDLFSEMRYDES